MDTPADLGGALDAIRLSSDDILTKRKRAFRLISAASDQRAAFSQAGDVLFPTAETRVQGFFQFLTESMENNPGHPERATYLDFIQALGLGIEMMGLVSDEAAEELHEWTSFVGAAASPLANRTPARPIHTEVTA